MQIPRSFVFLQVKCTYELLARIRFALPTVTGGDWIPNLRDNRKELDVTIRFIDNASPACASTMARLDDSITVAHTHESTMLLNVPRSIDEINDALETRDQGFMAKLKNFFA